MNEYQAVMCVFTFIPLAVVVLAVLVGLYLAGLIE
jgi:hypothetical protein